MSFAASQASKFYEQVAKQKVLFTLEDDGNYLVFPINGKHVVPYWSSRTRVQKVIQEHPKFGKFAIGETSLEEFFEKTLPQFREEKIHIGVNWSGARLTGYDLSPEELATNLKYNIDKWAAADSMDTDLSSMSLLELYRADIADS
jgi:hypothetical protein